jgi:hypothetical protein
LRFYPTAERINTPLEDMQVVWDCFFHVY